MIETIYLIVSLLGADISHHYVTMAPSFEVCDEMAAQAIIQGMERFPDTVAAGYVCVPISHTRTTNINSTITE